MDYTHLDAEHQTSELAGRLHFLEGEHFKFSLLLAELEVDPNTEPGEIEAQRKNIASAEARLERLRQML